MTIATKCSCIFCKKLTSNLGIAAHVNTTHNGINAWIKAGNKSRFGTPSWNKGLTKETSPSVKRGIEKLKLGIKSGKVIPSMLGRKMSDDFRKNQSEIMKTRYENGWEPVCGRCKKYSYITKTGEEIKVDGTWELIVAKYLDSQDLKWNRNKKRFKYIDRNGKERTYQPDFYVDDWKSFIEVKGYETDLDKCKWSQFPEKLIVWKKEQIQKLEDSHNGIGAVC